MDVLVFSTDSCSVVDPSTGLKVRLVAGEAWAADDPLVKALPHLFVKYPLVVRRTVEVKVVSPVESAVSVPGVKRQVKRGSEG